MTFNIIITITIIIIIFKQPPLSGNVNRTELGVRIFKIPISKFRQNSCNTINQPKSVICT